MGDPGRQSEPTHRSVTAHRKTANGANGPRKSAFLMCTRFAVCTIMIAEKRGLQSEFTNAQIYQLQYTVQVWLESVIHMNFL